MLVVVISMVEQDLQRITWTGPGEYTLQDNGVLYPVNGSVPTSEPIFISHLPSNLAAQDYELDAYRVLPDQWYEIDEANWLEPGWYGRAGSRIFFLCSNVMNKVDAHHVLGKIPGSSFFGVIMRPGEVPGHVKVIDTSGLAD